MPIVGNPLKSGTRDVIAIPCTLQGTGAAAPTLDVGGAKLLFGTPVRSATGLVSIPLNEAVVAVKITGAQFANTDYDGTPTRKRMIVRSKDTKTAKTITIAIENDADEGSNARADLAATESFDFVIYLLLGLTTVPS